MLRKTRLIYLLGFIILLVTSCQISGNNEVEKVGVLIETPLINNSWDARGYQGLVNIKEKYDIDVYLKENINSENAIIQAVNEFDQEGVTLIFGHSNFYGKYFNELANNFPNIHFVYFNGSYHTENLTSLNFNSHAMGFFSGMVAGKVSETNQIGILAAHEWQPEIEGFYEGVKFESPLSNVHINFVNHWNEQNRVDEIYEKMINNEVDVIYPTGELFAEDVLKRAVEDGISAIGYGMDQSYIDDEKILTSTIQHVDKLYIEVVEMAINHTLSGGVYYYDFQDDVISLGPFSPEVPTDYQQMINDYIETYKSSSLLPNEL